MNLAWEVTVDDVAIVLGRHAVQAGTTGFSMTISSATPSTASEWSTLHWPPPNSICSAAAALEEIDLILTEVGIVPA